MKTDYRAAATAVGVLALAGAAALCGGCKAAVGAIWSAWLTSTPQAQKAEYDLAPAAKRGRSLVIRVWVDPYIENHHERASLDVARAVVAAFKSKEDPNPIRGLEIVRPESVKRYLDSRRGGDAVSARELSEFFNAPLVLEIQLTEYSSKAAGSFELNQGRVTGEVALYDFTDEDAEEENKLPLRGRRVRHEFPEIPEAPRSDSSELAIWLQLRAGFAKKVADKFRDHEKMYDPRDNFRTSEDPTAQQ